MTANTFNHICDIGRAKLKFRPWIVKDQFAIKDGGTLYDKRKAMVYNCLEDHDFALDINEYQYVLFCIRNKSVDYITPYTVTCDHCHKDFVVDVDFNQVLSPRFAKYDDIVTANHMFELQEIKNQQFYEESMQNELNPEKRRLLDFVLHVKAVNGDFTKSASDVLELINNMEIKEFEDLFNKWESQHFTFRLDANAKCPFCEKESGYRFISVANFFPESWSNME